MKLSASYVPVPAANAATIWEHSLWHMKSHWVVRCWIEKCTHACMKLSYVVAYELIRVWKHVLFPEPNLHLVMWIVAAVINELTSSWTWPEPIVSCPYFTCCFVFRTEKTKHVTHFLISLGLLNSCCCPWCVHKDVVGCFLCFTLHCAKFLCLNCDYEQIIFRNRRLL